MQDEKIRLYSYALSPYAAKVHCFLSFKQLEFELFYVHPFRARAEIPIGHQVPVLTIDSEARNDSTPIGVWLDERYPDRKRLVPTNDECRQRVLSIDHWVSQELIPVVFRVMLAVGEPFRTRVRNRRRGARVLDATVPGGIPFPLRLIYPLVITRPRFIQQLIRSTDRSQPNRILLEKSFEDFIGHLAGGPFLGGQPEPTLADLSAYPQFALPFMAGYDRADAFTRNEPILEWFHRVASTLEGAKPLLPEALTERPLQSAARAEPPVRWETQ